MIKSQSILIFLACISTAFAGEALDFDMSAQERKQTGIYKLTNKEKAALQRWIDTHYDRRSIPLAKEDTEAHATLAENLHNGRYIRLSDHTLWEIRPTDTPLTQGWITPVDIIITRGTDSEYPYKLTNSLTGTSVYAKKASKAVQQPSSTS